MPTSSAAVNNPAIAPVLTGVRQQGDSVLLEWRDHSDGTAQFVVVRVVDGQGQPLGPLDPGTVHFTAQHLVPSSGPYCFVVLAIEHTFDGYQVGTSGERCTS
jgi:hypothetical protein